MVFFFVSYFGIFSYVDSFSLTDTVFYFVSLPSFLCISYLTYDNKHKLLVLLIFYAFLDEHCMFETFSLYPLWIVLSSFLSLIPRKTTRKAQKDISLQKEVKDLIWFQASWKEVIIHTRIEQRSRDKVNGQGRLWSSYLKM